MQDVHKIGLIDFDSPLPKMILWHSSNTLYSMVGHKPSQNCHQSCVPTGLSGRRFQLKMGFFSKERE